MMRDSLVCLNAKGASSSQLTSEGELAGNTIKYSGQVRADRGHGGDDDRCNEGHHQTVLHRRRPIFFFYEPPNLNQHDISFYQIASDDGLAKSI